VSSLSSDWSDYLLNKGLQGGDDEGDEGVGGVVVRPRARRVGTEGASDAVEEVGGVWSWRAC
jgi:hypothetical protein